MDHSVSSWLAREAGRARHAAERIAELEQEVARQRQAATDSQTRITRLERRLAVAQEALHLAVAYGEDYFFWQDVKGEDCTENDEGLTAAYIQDVKRYREALAQLNDTLEDAKNHG